MANIVGLLRDPTTVPIPPAGYSTLFIRASDGQPCLKDSSGVTTPLVGQPSDTDLTAIAALSTTSFGRSFLTLADASSGRTYINAETSGAAASAQAASQPLDSDLTAIAGLVTTTYGRSKLTLADAAADTAQLNVATTSLKGLMAFLDKLKLDGIWKDVVQDGGADRTGAVDATAQIQALQDAMTNGGVIYIPANAKIKIAGTVNISNPAVRILGASRRTSRIELSSATGDGFNITGSGASVENIRISTPSDVNNLRTAGFAITLAAGADSGYVKSCDILFQYSGVQSSGSLQFVEDCNIREYDHNGSNGQCILVNGSGDRYIRRITTDTGTNPTGFAGIRVTECASLVVSDCNIIHAGTCLAIEPANTKTVPSIEAVNCFFDSSVKGMAVTPSGTGVAYRSKFTNCWFGSNSTAGVEMNGTAWSGFSFSNCDFYGNAIGISCQTGGSVWSATGCTFAGNTTAGISLTASAAHDFKIHGCHFGTTGSFGVNAIALTLAAGVYAGIQVIDNTFGTNTLQFVDNGPTTSGSARKVICNNAGLIISAVPMVVTPATITTTTETVVYQIPIPVNSLLIGTTIKMTVSGIITATTPVITARLKVGTLGTSGDAEICVSNPAATAIATGTGWVWEAWVTVRSIGSGGTCLGNGILQGTASAKTIRTTTAAINTTVANFLSATLVIGGTTPVCTTVNAFAEVIQQ